MIHRIKIITVLCAFASFLIGCNSLEISPEGLEETLNVAGDNKEELFKVISHYKDSRDTLKFRAAMFLLSNMKDKYSCSGKVVDEYYHFCDSVFSIKKSQYDVEGLRKIFSKNALVDLNTYRPEIRLDAKSISSEILIDNIDKAFAAWNKPWNRSLSFSDFCEYILPYRVGTEGLEKWRCLYVNHFSNVYFSDTVKTAEQACTVINNKLISDTVRIYPNCILPIGLRPSTLVNLRFGTCEDCSLLAVYAMRSVGIPVGKAFIPQWGTKSGGHTFNVLLDGKGGLHDFLGAADNIDTHLKQFHANIPKVYLYTYGKQEESLAMLHGKEDVPRFLRNPYIKDITKDLSCINTANVKIKINGKVSKKFVYLCVFDQKGWNPVAWGHLWERYATFENVGVGIVYQLAYYDDDKIITLGSPFLLMGNGHIKYYNPQKEKIDKILERKNPESNAWENLSVQLIGGKFQGATNADFNKPITFFTIDKEPELKYESVIVESKTPVKFLRYLASPNTRGNMGEVEFYTDNSKKPLRGKIIGKYTPSDYFPSCGPEKMFDGDRLSFFHSLNNGCWGGIELDTPKYITKIRYIMRNDDNGIRNGELYELFYNQQGKWISLGKQTAHQDDAISFKGLPKGALYWLRNLSKGHEERIFEIDINGNIVWR